MTTKNLKPKIRFKGFTEDWEQHKFVDLYSFASEGGTPDTNNLMYYDGGSIPFVKIEDTEQKYIFETKSYITREGINNSSAWIVPKNSVIFTNGATVGNVAINSIPVATKQGIVGIIPDKKYYFEFLYYLLSSQTFQNNVASRMATGTFATIILKNLNEIVVSVPNNFTEQRCISDILSKIDNLITLHQRKYEKLTSIKKALLEKMFPGNGEKQPKIRFKDFTEDWEQRKFGDEVELQRGLTYSPFDISNDGIRVLRSSNIEESFFRLFPDDVFVKKTAVNIGTVKNGDILITCANGSPRLVGKHTIIKDLEEKTAVHGGFMLLARTDNCDFINASMSSSWYKKFLDVYVAGGNGAIGNLNATELANCDFLVPRVEEQQQLGNLFNKLDFLITLHQRKYEKLKNIKNALLERMFC